MKNLYSKFFLLQAIVFIVAMPLVNNPSHQVMLFQATIASGLGCLLSFLLKNIGE